MDEQMAEKAKLGIFVFGPEKILIECPFCGMNLIKTDYNRITKLFENHGVYRGKKCKCGGIVVLKLDKAEEAKVKAKIGQIQSSAIEVKDDNRT